MPGSIAFTYDDGPDPFSTPLVLDALARASVKATFFVIAPLARAHPELVARTLSEGHSVQHHCTRHVRHSEMSPEEVDDDTVGALATLAELGVTPGLWRTPWGVTEPFTAEIAGRHGLSLTDWSCDSEDWSGDSAEDMLDRLRPGVEDGAVLLMHDGIGPGATREDATETAELVAPLAELARRRGLEPSTLGARPARA